VLWSGAGRPIPKRRNSLKRHGVVDPFFDFVITQAMPCLKQ